jgi:hypothetical protein
MSQKYHEQFISYECKEQRQNVQVQTLKISRIVTGIGLYHVSSSVNIP